MCWACNPYCGGCKPPKERPRQCTECGAYNFDVNARKCRKCGAILPERIKPTPIFCLQTQTMCPNPCGKGKIMPRDGQKISCKWNPEPPPNETEKGEGQSI